MAEIRLTTGQVLKVVEDVNEVQRMLATSECIKIGFIEFTQNNKIEYLNPNIPDRTIQEHIFVNIAHVIMYY